jgi:hypothetical protein
MSMGQRIPGDALLMDATYVEGKAGILIRAIIVEAGQDPMCRTETCRGMMSTWQYRHRRGLR